MTLSDELWFSLPPTTNDLTPKQRSLLVRRTKKIEQLLGSTPYLVDTFAPTAAPISVFLPSTGRLMKCSRVSLDSMSSSSSSEATPTVRQPKSIISISSIDSQSPSTITLDSCDNSPKLPVLRMALKSLSLEIPAPPPATRTSLMALTDSDDSTSESPTSSTDDFESSDDGQKSIVRSWRRLGSRRKPPLALQEHNTVVIPSANTLRKQKMDRLRKKLGSDVPFELVFPSDVHADRDELSSAQSDISPVSPPLLVSRVPEPVIVKKDDSPSLPPSLSRNALPRSTTTRDDSSIHYKRRSQDVAKHVPRYRRPRTAPSSTDTKRQLPFIIESPDEQGTGGEEIGIAISTDDATGFQSESRRSNTMKGYRAWASSYAPPVHAPNPQIAATPTSYSSPTTVKKRPASYRKPPPPIPNDIDQL